MLRQRFLCGKALLLLPWIGRTRGPPDRKEGEGEEDMEGEPDTMETGE